MEITYNPSEPDSFSETAKTIGELKQRFAPSGLHVGAGTVLYENQVKMTFEAGGEYIISPNVNQKVIQKTRELGMLSMPGAMTPTECESAHEYGADYVKIFPCSNLGAGYVKAIAAPMSHIKFLAVGGVSPLNVADFMKAGAYGFGVGGDLIDKKAVADNDFEKITQRAYEYASEIAKSLGDMQ